MKALSSNINLLISKKMKQVIFKSVPALCAVFVSGIFCLQGSRGPKPVADGKAHLIAYIIPIRIPTEPPKANGTLAISPDCFFGSDETAT